jgi:hypothetical protein
MFGADVFLDTDGSDCVRFLLNGANIPVRAANMPADEL